MLQDLNALIPDDALRAKILALLEAELAQKEAKQKELEETLEQTILTLHGEVREKLRLQEEFRKKADEKFRIAAELAGDYIYEATIDGGKVRAMYVSPEFTTLTGYSMNEINQGEGWLDLIHPDDLPYFRAIMESASIGRPIVIEYRVRRKDGGTIWLRDFSRPILDETGRYLKSIGISRNITAEKEAELALQRERQLLDIIFNTVPIGICLSDENGAFLRVNQALADISGYDANELLGRHFSIIVAEEHRAFAKEAHQTFMQGASLITSGESMVQRKDGERRWVAFTARKFQREDGRWYRVTATGDITKKREQEKEIARLLELLARTESLAHIGSWEFDFETYRFTKWSDELFRIYERPMELGAPTCEEFSALYTSAETNERLQSWVNELIRSGGKGEIEIPITTHRGHHKFVRLREVIIFQDGKPALAQGMTEDITEERRQKEETKRLLELLARTESLARIGSWELDLKTNRFTKWSDELFRIYERPLELGLPTFEEYKARYISPEDDARMWQWAEKELYQKQSDAAEFEFSLITHKGNRKFVRMRASMIYENGVPVRVQGSKQDITREKLLEQQKENLMEQLIQAQKMEAIGTLTGGIAHEFNNILSGMLGNVKLLEQKFGSDPKAKKYIERLIALNQRAATIVAQMMGFARKGKYELKPVSLKTSIDNVLRILLPTTDRRIRFHLETAADAPLIQGDATQIEQVILNLAKNAVDAIEPLLGKEREQGHITFRLSFEPIAERFRNRNPNLDDAPKLMLEVRDNGMGIPEDIRNRIFEPFFTTKPVGKGTGLGLPMVHGIVENHNGYLFVESEAGKGTSFFLYFPVASEHARESIEPTNENARALSGLCVLVIDDEATVREMLAEHLRELGATVEVAAGGREGLEKFQALPKENLVVTLDLNMPDMNGEQALEELKLIDAAARVIVGTGYVEEAQVNRLKALGASSVLIKPFDLDEIATEIALLAESARS